MQGSMDVSQRAGNLHSLCSKSAQSLRQSARDFRLLCAVARVVLYIFLSECSTGMRCVEWSWIGGAW